MKLLGKRIISLIASAAMIVSCISVNASPVFAEEETTVIAAEENDTEAVVSEEEQAALDQTPAEEEAEASEAAAEEQEPALGYEEAEAYAAAGYMNKVESVKKDGTAYGMFKIGDSIITPNEDGTYHVVLNCTRVTYTGIYFGYLGDADKETKMISATDIDAENKTEKFEFDIPAEYLGTYQPVVYWNASSTKWVDSVNYLAFKDFNNDDAVAGLPVSASVTAISQGENVYLAAFNEPMDVISYEAEYYGYTDQIDPAVGVSALDVMVAATKAIFGETYTIAAKDECLSVSDAGYVSVIFGVPTTANGFMVNKGTPNDGTESQWGGYNGLTVNKTVVKSGDTVDFFTYSDTTAWSDYMTYVEVPEAVSTGSDMDVTVKAVSIMNGYLYKTADDMSAAAAPLEGAGLGWVDMTTGEVTAVADTTTDENGKAVIKAPSAAGTYYLAALSNSGSSVYTILNTTAVNVQYLNKVVSLKQDGTSYGMFPIGSSEITANADGTYHVVINVSGNATYSGIYFGYLGDSDKEAKLISAEEWDKDAKTAKYEFDIPAEYLGTYQPVVYWNASKSKWVTNRNYLGFMDINNGDTITGFPVKASVYVDAQGGNAYFNGLADTITVSSDEAEYYGYTDQVDPAAGVSALDVLVAETEALYGTDYTMDGKDTYLKVNASGYMSVLFGVETYACGFMVNKAIPNDGTESQWGGYNGLTVNQAVVKDNDVVDFFLYSDDSYYSDYLTYVEVPASVAAGYDFRVTVKGTMIMSAYLYKDAAELEASAEALEDVKLGWLNMTTGAVEEIADAVTDENGAAMIKAPSEVGTYYLVALSYVDEEEYIENYTIMNPTEVTVVSPAYLNKVVSVKNDGFDYGMFRINDSCMTENPDGSYHVVLHIAGNVTYTGIYFGYLGDADKEKNTVYSYDLDTTAKTETFEFDIPAEYLGTYQPVVYWNNKSSKWVSSVNYLGFRNFNKSDVIEGLPVKANVTAVSQKDNAYVYPFNMKLEVYSYEAEYYGYTDQVDPADGVSALDVLVAETAAIYGDDFTIEKKNDYLTVSDAGYVSVIFATATTANGFMINKGTPNDGTESAWGGYNGLTVNQAIVKDGDVLDFFTYSDTITWSDKLTYVEVPASVGADNDFTVTVKAVSIMNGYLYSNGDEMRDAATALSSAKLGWLDMTTGEITAISNAVTDTNGQAVIHTPATEGQYYLVALSDTENAVYTILNPTELTVTALPTTVKVTSAANDTSGITVKWNRVDDINCYSIYRSETNGTQDKKVGDVITSATSGTLSFTDNTAVSGHEYTYYVKSYDGKYYSYASNSKTIVRLAMTKITAIGNSSTGVVVRWTKVEGADGYYVYRSVNGAAATRCKTIKSGDTVAYCDKAAIATNGDQVSYTICSYKTGSDKSVNVSKGRVSSTIYKVVRPEITKAALKSSSGSKYIYIKWTEPLFSTVNIKTVQYKVMRSVNGGSYKTIATVSTKNYSDTTVKAGKTYSYKIIAIVTDGTIRTGSCKSAASADVTVK